MATTEQNRLTVIEPLYCDRAAPLPSYIQNTFQVVLASDGVSSYALFLYADIQWSKTDSPIGSGSGSGSGRESDNGLSLRYQLF